MKSGKGRVVLIKSYLSLTRRYITDGVIYPQLCAIIASIELLLASY